MGRGRIVGDGSGVIYLKRITGRTLTFHRGVAIFSHPVRKLAALECDELPRRNNDDGRAVYQHRDRSRAEAPCLSGSLTSLIVEVEVTRL
jgi:hypothetical protein